MSQLHELKYNDVIEEALSNITACMQGEYSISKRSIALLLLQKDADITSDVMQAEHESYDRICSIVEDTEKHFGRPLNYVISVERQEKVNQIVDKHVQINNKKARRVSEFVNSLTMNPITAIPILLLVLYFGLYKFVGVFGAGTVVDYIETKIFARFIDPFINNTVDRYIPWNWLQDLLARDYGILTLGFRYAIAIILPIVGTFFIAFSIIEDSGYLPRLAMMVDRVFKKIGLNGRAVIPMTLGFGCDTMATMVSRTLETKRERIIATFLLSLAIPCSAQLGVVLSLLSSTPVALIVWVMFITFIFLLIGFLTARLMPGDKPAFYMELPPLRLPKLSNVLVKTYTRLQWYFIEILPLFVLASIIIWFGNISGLFDVAVRLLRPLVTAIGLPVEAAQTFLFGFFRRDYGAAGLYDLQKTGVLSPRQLAVAASTLTLFVPCLAQFAMTAKERGYKAAFSMAAFIFPFSFLAGFILNKILVFTGVL